MQDNIYVQQPYFMFFDHMPSSPSLSPGNLVINFYWLANLVSNSMLLYALTSLRAYIVGISFSLVMVLTMYCLVFVLQPLPFPVSFPIIVPAVYANVDIPRDFISLFPATFHKAVVAQIQLSCVILLQYKLYPVQ